MTVPQGNFPILNFEQNNPLLTGIQKGLSMGYGARGSENQLRTDAFKRALLEKYGVQEAEQGIEKDRLANALSQIELQYAPQTAETALAYKQGQIPLMNEQAQTLAFKRNNPLVGTGGAAGQIGALDFLQHQGNPHAATLERALSNEQQRKDALMERLNVLNKSQDFKSLPMDAKSFQIGLARSMGYTPDEAAHAFNQGLSINDLGEAKGYTQEEVRNLIPSMVATKATLNRQQLANTALAGLNAIEPIMTQALAPYSQKIIGMSPKLAWEGLRGVNEDSQAKALAANALAPELAALRIKAQGGTIGITAIQEVRDASLQRLHQFEGIVTPTVYRKMNEHLGSWINKMNAAENKAVLGLQNNNQPQQRSHNYNQEDIAYTAEKYGMTEEEVLNKLLGEEESAY
jgi:hypothetical protein